MGLVRKAFAVGTLGMTPVGFNSKKEQIRNNTGQMAKLMAQQLAYTEGTPQYAARLQAERRHAARLARVVEHEPMSLPRYIIMVLTIPIAVVVVLFVLAALLSL